MPHTRTVRLLPLLFATLVFAQTLSAVPRSNRIWIEHGGLMTGETSGYRFMQIIGNTSEQPLWLTVRQGAGSSACEVTAKVEPKKNGTFACDVADVKPGKVPVVIEVFADEARTQQLESHREEMSFSKRDIRTLKDFTTATRLPVTYEGISYSAKLGFGSLFRHFVPANGKLEISDSAVEYTHGKFTLTVPASRIRNVDVFGVRDAPPWVVMIYEDASGELKRAGFQPPIHRLDDARSIIASLQAAAASAAQDITESVAGETLADALLQRDTARMILQHEKVRAPECPSAKVVDTKMDEEPTNVAVKDLRPVRGEWSERWLVDRCGVQVAYGVKYTADPQGGTFIAVEQP